MKFCFTNNLIESITRTCENYVYKDHARFTDDLVLVNLILLGDKTSHNFIYCAPITSHEGATSLALTILRGSLSATWSLTFYCELWGREYLIIS